ncbi:DUF4974 domain-containing protein [Sphingobacterium sp. InxBP1]|uniref:FecR family protein n=1 Tax=Sphingobacterium sp. InxBP1 TaxID=2870328 RepID=UPI002244455E|nr:FecR domain-containing protein [Sphingobacterium sp. InxBP1]MCW8313043.1 DUF4974 domain-containing protein [Sphingobacterium sp. InxBP1]
MEGKAQLKDLIERFNLGRCSKEELELLSKLLESRDSAPELDTYWNEPEENQILPSAHYSNSRFDQYIRNRQQTKERKIRSHRLKMIAGLAASIAVFVSIIGLYLTHRQDSKNLKQANLTATSSQTAIPPGQEKAKIIFENGKSIDLETLPTGQIVHVGKIGILKGKDGTISYVNTDTDRPTGSPVYNKIVTPRAGEYNLMLPDGTQVWLNAMTALRYPISFNNKARIVELNGEAYFKVSKRQSGGKRLPFIVNTGDQQLEVLGTEFNINSYSKHIQTTLVEGSISLRNKKSRKAPLLLKPNQMAQMNLDDGELEVSEVDPFYIIAWKNGQFAFDNTPLREIMESLGRWYDVDIVYQSDLSGIRFSGTVSRFEQLDKLLKFLELSGDVHFTLKGRRVIVMK